MSSALSDASATIPDLQTGLELLSQLPLANSSQAEIGLNVFFDRLLRKPPESDVYLELLEQSREALCFVEEDLARQFTDRPLPLSSAEEACFRRVIATWLKVARAYAHCAVKENALGETRSLARLALMMHRCIYYTGMVMVEHQRARRQLPPKLWNNLLGYYYTAEKWGVAQMDLPDPLDTQQRASNCTTTFVGLLLSELVSLYSLSASDQNLVRRWAGNWAPLVGVVKTAGKDLPEFIVDLTEDQALLPSADCKTPPEKIRILDTSRLVGQIKEYRRQLKEKTPPAEMGLGYDCDAKQCSRLLKFVIPPWSLARVQRKTRRLGASGTVEICLNPESIHHAIAGCSFVQPGSVPAPKIKESAEPVIEQWGIVNQSASGLRLQRPIVGGKIAHGQLLAIRTNAGAPFLLAQATWLMQEHGGSLLAGVELLPGKPQAIAARRPVERDEPAEPFVRAFALPAVVAIESEASLLVPHGWFRAGKSIEVFFDALGQIKFKRLLHEAPDFDRVSYVTK